jgi:4-aminobutyrate aminotransferase-like enzyme
MSKARRTIKLLQAYESRNVLFTEPDGSWPIVWERAQGVHVWDAEKKKYLDLTAAFGVAAAGHANKNVVHAGQTQMGRLLHAMGDVHPHAVKADLARELSRLTFERWHRGSGKVIFSSSGFEAVETALKTALLATGKHGIIAFTGGYHGLGYGTLNATHRKFFHQPFRSQLRQFGRFARFSTSSSNLVALEAQLNQLCRRHAIGAMLVEPVQARGGIQVPPLEFLPLLRRVCDEYKILLIVDEIYTGFGRTGKWFACEHSEVIPDLICLGKALTGGFPLSVCVGQKKIMDRAWPVSTGEALHTSTFLGHPVGCAMALAQIQEIQRLNLCRQSHQLGRFLLAELAKINTNKKKVIATARGLGLMAGLELTRPDGRPATKIAIATVKKLLSQGYIFLPEGENANVIGFTPPLTITRSQLLQAIHALAEALP